MPTFTAPEDRAIARPFRQHCYHSGSIAGPLDCILSRARGAAVSRRQMMWDRAPLAHKQDVRTPCIPQTPFGDAAQAWKWRGRVARSPFQGREAGGRTADRSKQAGSAPATLLCLVGQPYFEV